MNFINKRQKTKQNILDMINWFLIYINILSLFTIFVVFTIFSKHTVLGIVNPTLMALWYYRII